MWLHEKNPRHEEWKLRKMLVSKINEKLKCYIIKKQKKQRNY